MTFLHMNIKIFFKNTRTTNEQEKIFFKKIQHTYFSWGKTTNNNPQNNNNQKKKKEILATTGKMPCHILKWVCWSCMTGRNLNWHLISVVVRKTIHSHLILSYVFLKVFLGKSLNFSNFFMYSIMTKYMYVFEMICI